MAYMYKIINFFKSYKVTLLDVNNIYKIDVDISLTTFDIYLIHKKEIISVTAQEFIKFIKKDYK